MYQALTDFLVNFSAHQPLLWALLVMLFVAGVGLFLYGFWEVTLRGLGRLWVKKNRGPAGPRP